MKNLFFIVLFSLTSLLSWADQHVFLGKDWSRLNAEQKAMVLEGVISGMFAAQEVLRNELDWASTKATGEAVDVSNDVRRLNVAVLIEFSRIPSQEALIKALDRWARAQPTAALAECISSVIFGQNWPEVYVAKDGRGPADGYNDITRKALSYVDPRN